MKYIYLLDWIGGNMRLFIAINFNDSVKEKIQNLIDKFQKFSYQGRFVSKEHLHLTLEFLGEIPEQRVDVIKKIMDNASFKPFSLKLSNIGYFKRPQGNIYWIGLEENKNLKDLQLNIHNLLINEGFKLEDRPFTPHITLGRQVKLKEGFDYYKYNTEIKDTVIQVNRVDLMKSERIDGKLVYSIIYSKQVK